MRSFKRRIGLSGLMRKRKRNRTPSPLELALASVQVGEVDVQFPKEDLVMARRIVQAYKESSKKFGGHGDSMWSWIHDLSRPMHEVLLDGDAAAVADSLSRPHKTYLLNGFDNPVAAPFMAPDGCGNLLSNEIAEDMKDRVYLALRRLCEATGAVKISNPETGFQTTFSVDQYLELLDSVVEATIDFPNPYHGEKGIISDRGIISFRPLQAIYQAWRLKALGAETVVEIGAGLGRTAYYAMKFGVKKYVIVDLPLTNVAQADFLSRTLGSDMVSFSGEVERPVHIADTSYINSFDGKVDCVLNADSLSEMDAAVAQEYVSFAKRYCTHFISINREWDGAPRVFDLLQDLPSTRYPYWMREGYVEEVFDCSKGSGRDI